MANDSTVAGYLTPDANPAPLEDAELDKFLHDLIVGVTGLPGDMVRPRWQAEPPTQPERADDWMAFGVMDEDADTYAATVHTIDSSEVQRHEYIDILISSYGPHGRGNMKLLRDGLQVEQNRAALSANAMGLVETGRIITAPSLAKDLWLNRFDMTMRLRRENRRVFGVKSIASGVIQLDDEVIQETIQVNPPAP